MLADQMIRVGDAGVAIAGGMESMSRPPYLLLKAREGYRLGNSEVIDALMYDGLTDAYSNKPMGCFADQCASKFGFTRQQQDDFAVGSHTRARKAVADKVFVDEIAPVSITVRGKTTTVSEDEGLNKFDEAKMRGLRAAFNADGTVTAGNASSINDGAAALLVASREKCQSLGLKPRARIVGAAIHSQEPEWFTTAPVGAIKKLLDKVGWDVADGRPVRGQRGVRRGRPGRRQGAGPAAREDQHLRRCRATGPSDRLQRRPAPGHAPQRSEANRRPARRRRPLRRRRRGDRDGRRDRRLNRPLSPGENQMSSSNNNSNPNPSAAADPAAAMSSFWAQWLEQSSQGTQAMLEAMQTVLRPAADPAPLARRHVPQPRRLHAVAGVPRAHEE